ncbi:MAG: redoxin domain-containing protein [Bacteroidales bacterium]|nr:redoxin domain-containing protein [Bacteroidales bacterium]
MKQQVILVLLAVWALSSCYSGDKFTVKGEISGADTKTVYFDASTIEGIQVLDSVKLSGTGTFSFEGKRPESPEFYRLRIDGKIINFAVDSTETVTIKAPFNKFETEYSIEDSQNNTKIKELVLMLADLQEKVLRISKQNLPIGIAQSQVATLVNEYKDNVKRNYIFAAPNATPAYFALFQTLNGYMIFDPVSNREDVKCFAAVATSLNIAYPHADRSRNLYNMAVKGMKNTRLNPVKQVEIPQEKIHEATLIDIKLNDVNGKQRSLTELKGNVVVLDFTIYNNTQSAAHNLALRELYNKYHNEGLEIYQVSFDADEHYWKVNADNLPWICVRDEDGAYSTNLTLYGINNLPSLFLIDRENALVARGETITDFEAELRKLL